MGTYNLYSVDDNSSDSDSFEEVPHAPSSKKNGNLAKVTSKIRDLKIPHRRERVFGGPLKEGAKNQPNRVPFGKLLIATNIKVDFSPAPSFLKIIPSCISSNPRNRFPCIENKRNISRQRSQKPC